MAWLITLTVFGGVIAIVAIDNHYNLQKKKLDAELRMREMEAGVAPGTYSRPSKKEMKKAQRARMKSQRTAEPEEEEYTPDPEAEREMLLKGINDLKTRIDNIDTIMADKKQHKGEMDK